jgi:hypothetical protein
MKGNGQSLGILVESSRGRGSEGFVAKKAKKNALDDCRENNIGGLGPCCRLRCSSIHDIS